MCPMVASCVEIEGVGGDRVLRQRLQRQRRDELLRRVGHHDAHLGAGLDQRAHQLRRLVRRDAARDADDDASPLQGPCVQRNTDAVSAPSATAAAPRARRKTRQAGAPTSPSTRRRRRRRARPGPRRSAARRAARPGRVPSDGPDAARRFDDRRRARRHQPLTSDRRAADQVSSSPNCVVKSARSF